MMTIITIMLSLGKPLQTHGCCCTLMQMAKMFRDISTNKGCLVDSSLRKEVTNLFTSAVGPKNLPLIFVATSRAFDGGWCKIFYKLSLAVATNWGAENVLELMEMLYCTGSCYHSHTAVQYWADTAWIMIWYDIWNKSLKRRIHFDILTTAKGMPKNLQFVAMLPLSCLDTTQSKDTYVLYTSRICTTPN